MKPGLYLHIPFCQTKCGYCDFFSITDSGQIEGFLAALEQEVDLWRNLYPLYDTLYLGGGTPSYLSVRDLENLVSLLSRTFNLTPDAEVTLEANPDDVTLEKLRLWKDLGINRLSLGVQSLHEAELRFLGRRHTASQARLALAGLREAGFENIGVDLMYALPGQKLAEWLDTLQAVLVFEPEHLSCYQLTIEDQTPLGKALARKEFVPATEEEQRALYLCTSEYLENKGYLHYEVSNFARREQNISRHNSKYWQQAPYLGLGPGAHSFDGRRRWWNVRSIPEYCRRLGEGKGHMAGEEILTEAQQHLEALCLGLRTKRGVGLATFDHFPQARQTLAGFCRDGLMMMKQGRACPTREGFLVADSLAVMLSE